MAESFGKQKLHFSDGDLFYINTHTDSQTTNMGEEGNPQELIQIGSIGKIGLFDESLETWKIYMERVDLYF